MKLQTVQVSCALALAFGSALYGQDVLSPFAGSVVKGVYAVDYDALVYTTSLQRDPDIRRVEGRLRSRVLLKPENKSNLEVFRSYQRELQAGGFQIHFAPEPSRPLVVMLQKLDYPPNTRAYQQIEARVGRGDLDRIRAFPEYYLIASRTQGVETVWVMISICTELNLYLIEELTTEAMETGTVTLSLDRLRSEISAVGKIAVYDIHFATGSAEIAGDSETALAVIASYLRETSSGFYVVGHTDDTGSLESNLDLSQRRAAAVKQALAADYGVDAGRLEARGAGPLAPVSNNTGEAGRALNRRVEIVERLP